MKDRENKMAKILENKNIVLGVCGGIAAYKAAELLRLIVKQGGNVRVMMTESATKFVSPMTFEALSGQPVCTTLFDDKDEGAIRHIEWAEQADAVVLAPATANIIGKLANGLADDALSTFMLAVTSPRIICPSMNTHMYENMAVQRNIDALVDDGFIVVEPEEGELACGTTGAGRLPEPVYIVDRLIRQFYTKDLKGRRILISAGPTREAIDPVRFISNHSSGKMGYAIAKAAEYRGGDVVLISGPTKLTSPAGVKKINVVSAAEMADAVFDRMDSADIIIKVAAVADYRPQKTAEHKIKKTQDALTLSLEKNIDILKALGSRKKKQILVGFAAETRDLDDNAQKKLAAKNLDMIVGNLVGDPKSGFGTDTNKVTLYFKDGKQTALPIMEKDEVAHFIFDHITSMLK